MINYKKIADNFINLMIRKDGMSDTIHYLLGLGLTKDELINNMGFTNHDVLMAVDYRL